MKAVGKTIINICLHLAAIGFLGYLFQPFAEQILALPKLSGFDADQFIFYVYQNGQNPGLPPGKWDHLWYEGAPRVLNMTFLPFYLIQPLVAWWGLNVATKVFPLFWTGIFFLFAYGLFYRLAKSIPLAVGLTAVLIFTQNSYIPIFRNGVVLAGLAQCVLPLMLFLLVVFVQTKKTPYLILAGLAAALSLYFHGGIGLFFVCFSAFVMVLFSGYENERWLGAMKMKRFLGLGAVIFSTGALAVFPQVFNSLGGGYYTRAALEGHNLPVEDVFSLLLEQTNSGLWAAIGLSVLVGLVFFRKIRFRGLILPLSLMLAYVVVFLAGIRWGLNPMGEYFFPNRIYWYLVLIGASLAALLFSGLSGLEKGWWRWLSVTVQLLITGVLLAFVWVEPMATDRLFPERGELSLSRQKQDAQLERIYKTALGGLTDQVDPADTNWRVWLHNFPKIYWNIVSPVPLFQGYFHFYTKYSVNWTDWLFASTAKEAFEMKTLPETVAQNQGQFLLDWYGLKYLVVYPNPEFNVADFYWRDEFLEAKNADIPPAVLTIRPEYRSGIVEAVDVPVVGFVGNDGGYDAFLRTLALLNYNTRYLVPLRLATSIEKIPEEAYGAVDLLVLYNFEGKNWGRLERYVREGGRIWLETGGESAYRQAEGLGELFPCSGLNYQSLGKEWQAEKSEEMAGVDFGRLKPLAYRETDWKLSYCEGPLSGGAKALLVQKGKPIVTEKALGKGLVLWSGGNFWYRTMEYLSNSEAESAVIKAMLDRAVSLTRRDPLAVKVTRETPERISIAGGGYKGIVFKENYLPGWKAGSGEGKAAIFAAGPDLMYIAAAKKATAATKMEISYRGPWLHWFLLVLSLAGSALVISDLVGGGWLRRRLDRGMKVFKVVAGWWEKEEN